ncbi:Uncharacterised protein [Yersinia similis]|uniref:Uncharacterized protein n=1 Tax=Yersinia similis TaxID=367190 RepID=A0A0T9QPZ6_9GAMM|nr:Uncharacterised protein [Yersinia similis]CNB63749.1 Uncharacterised protein [Yersinia similis]CNF69202.1 Uncharacterised protein [Yersinia similis]CNG49398.1 Uncharacterised protein [Yersinia similis]CNI20716.1 Uncharacterised protein [Yersinia similis]
MLMEDVQIRHNDTYLIEVNLPTCSRGFLVLRRQPLRASPSRAPGPLEVITA